MDANTGSSTDAEGGGDDSQALEGSREEELNHGKEGLLLELDYSGMRNDGLEALTAEELLGRINAQAKMALKAQIDSAQGTRDDMMSVVHVFRDMLRSLPLPQPTSVDIQQAIKDAGREAILVSGSGPLESDKVFEGDSAGVQAAVRRLLSPLVYEKAVEDSLVNDIMRASSRTSWGGDAYSVVSTLLGKLDAPAPMPADLQTSPIHIQVSSATTLRKSEMDRMGSSNAGHSVVALGGGTSNNPGDTSANQTNSNASEGLKPGTVFITSHSAFLLYSDMESLMSAKEADAMSENAGTCATAPEGFVMPPTSGQQAPPDQVRDEDVPRNTSSFRKPKKGIFRGIGSAFRRSSGRDQSMINSTSRPLTIHVETRVSLGILGRTCERHLSMVFPDIEGAPPQCSVLGAGEQDVNGTYFLMGFRFGSPYYANRTGVYLTRESTKGVHSWVFGRDNTIFYQATVKPEPNHTSHVVPTDSKHDEGVDRSVWEHESISEPPQPPQLPTPAPPLEPPPTPPLQTNLDSLSSCVPTRDPTMKERPNRPTQQPPKAPSSDLAILARSSNDAQVSSALEGDEWQGQLEAPTAPTKSFLSESSQLSRAAATLGNVSAADSDPAFKSRPKPNGYRAATDDISAEAPTVMLIREMNRFPGSDLNIQPMGPVGGVRVNSNHFAVRDG